MVESTRDAPHPWSDGHGPVALLDSILDAVLLDAQNALLDLEGLLLPQVNVSFGEVTVSARCILDGSRPRKIALFTPRCYTVT